MTVGYYAIDQREMTHGVYHKQFNLSLQPIINIEKENIETFEVFVRWKHPLLGMLPPSFFMPRAVELGVAPKITDYIINQSVEICNKSMHVGNNTGININLNLHEIRRNQTLDSLACAIDALNGAPERICLEITPKIWLDFFHEHEEDNLNPEAPPGKKEMQHLETLKSIFEIYADIGITLALDTCHYVEGALQRAGILGFHAIKISGQCLNNITYLKECVAKAKKLNIALVATAVENDAQLKTVLASGVNYIQGISMCPPVYECDINLWNKGRLSEVKQSLNQVNNSRSQLKATAKAMKEDKNLNNPYPSFEKSDKLTQKRNRMMSPEEQKKRMEQEHNRVRSLDENDGDQSMSYFDKNR